MLFDILILIGLFIASASGVHTAFESHRHYEKTKALAERQIAVMEANNSEMRAINKEVKEFRKQVGVEVKQVIEEKTSICPKYGMENCGLCKETGACVFEALVTRPQKDKVVK